MAEIKIQNLVLGMIQTNVYFVQNQDTKEIIVIDPADEAGRIMRKIREMEGSLAAILLTHGHYDHFGAADALRRENGAEIWCEESEQEVLSQPEWNTSPMHGLSAVLKADHYVHEGEEIVLAGIPIRVMHTPGHTKGCVCWYLPDYGVLFSGDTLFCESYGRTDFPTGSSRQMMESVRRLVKELPEDTVVYPGHMMATTIEHERKYNPLSY